MNMAKRAFRAVDDYQQRHAWLAFPVAVWKKFGDDQAGNLAALIAYSALVAIFPLLLLLLTVLDIVLKNDPAKQQQLVNAALKSYPVIGPQLQGHIGHLSQTGTALAVAVIGIFIGALGVSNSLQNALNSAWEIPFARRPGFPWSWLRSAALIIVVGTGLIATTVLSGLAAGVRVLPGTGASVLSIAVSLVLNFGLFWLGLQARHRERDHLAAAVARRRHQRGFLAGTPGHRHHLRVSSARPRLAAVRHVRPGARADRLALPAGPAHLVRRPDQRGPGLPAVAAKPGPAAIYGTRPPCVPAIRREARRPIRHRGGGRR